MIVSSMTGTPCLDAFLGAVFAAAFSGRFFGVARFDVFFRAGLALAFRRFEVFLRVARRFLALTMAVPCEVCPK
jgi:cytochrome c biogenesis protein CcdA